MKERGPETGIWVVGIIVMDNGLDEPVRSRAVSKLLLREFGIHHELESCERCFAHSDIQTEAESHHKIVS